MLTFEQFKNYYLKTGRCINDISVRNNPLNDIQLKRRFDKYVQQEENRLLKKRKPIRSTIDNNEKIAFKEVSKRDKDECRLIRALLYQPSSQLNILQENSNGAWRIIDHAHFLSKGIYPLMKYEVDNIVCLNRYSHSNLDKSRHPITGKRISKEEAQKWWLTILGKEQYNKVLLIARSKGYRV